MENGSKDTKRMPNLSKLGIAILEHTLEPVIGKTAQEVIKAPLIEKKLRGDLAKALENAESRFLTDYEHKEISQAILQLPLANLDSVKQALRIFYQRPTDTTLRELLLERIKEDLPSFTREQAGDAIETYLKILQEELISVSAEIREKIIALKILEIADHLKNRNNSSHVQSPNEFTTQILIVFNGNLTDDRALAFQIAGNLKHRYAISFHDHSEPVDQEKVRSYQDEIRQSDFIIALLSEHTIASEMMLYELETARKRISTLSKKTFIVPVAVKSWTPPRYPLSEYIGNTNWIIWLSYKDTNKVETEIGKAILGESYGISLSRLLSAFERSVNEKALHESHSTNNPTLTDLHIESPGGTMGLESCFYMKRREDDVLLRELARTGTTITIKAPRQMGKSSLLIRGIDHALHSGKKAVYLDFQQFEDHIIKEPSLFYKNFCRLIAKELNMKNIENADYWGSGSTNTYLCTSFIEEHILSSIEEPLLLALDEADRLLGSPFSSDFFGMLRSWHNQRWKKRGWERLDLALVISTEPFMLIPHASQSPFNVGEIIILDEFTIEHVSELNLRHRKFHPKQQAPFTDAQIAPLMKLLGGHPHLIRQAMYRVTIQEYEAQALFDMAVDDHGPFADHLQRQLMHLMQNDKLTVAMKQIIAHNTSPDDKLTFRLEGAGLVKRIGKSVVLRNGLYDKYFRERL